MGDFEVFALVLLGLWVWEGLVWVPRGRELIALRWGRWRSRVGWVVLGNERGHLAPGGYIPWVGACLLADQSGSTDAVAAGERWREARALTLGARWWSGLLAAWVFGAMLPVWWWHGLELVSVVVVAPALVLHGGAVVAFARAYRRVYPGRGDRWEKVLGMALLPPAAMHAGVRLEVGSMERFHPLAVLAGLRRQGGKVDWQVAAERVVREASFAGEAGASSGKGGAPEGRVGSAGWREWIRAEFGKDVVMVSPTCESGARAYCPRCLAQYVRTAGECSDCSGVELAQTVETEGARARGTR